MSASVGLGFSWSRAATAYDHSALAIAALRNVVLDPRPLHGVQRVIRPEAFDGGDLLVADRADRQRTGAHRRAVHMHRAGAALRDAAAELCPHQAEHIPQHPKRGMSESTSISWACPLTVSRVTFPPTETCRASKPARDQPRARFKTTIRAKSSPSALTCDFAPGRIPSTWSLQQERRPHGPPLALTMYGRIWMLWFFSGNERMRLPVAAKKALSTAGAATQMVGSPTPPQNAAGRHDDGFDLRHFGDAHRSCRCRSSSARCAVLDGAFAVEQRRQAVDERAGDLALDLRRIDGVARIGGADDAVDLDLVAASTDISAPPPRSCRTPHVGEAAVDALRRRLAPAAFSATALSTAGAWDLSSACAGTRADPGRRLRQFVHEALDVDGVLVDVHAAPEARRDVRVAHRMIDQQVRDV